MENKTVYIHVGGHVDPSKKAKLMKGLVKFFGNNLVEKSITDLPNPTCKAK